MNKGVAKQAVLYRMVLPDHICPYGLKARDLLRRRGFEVEDHPLRTRTETDAFKAEQGVSTTPQIFIGGTRIGGYSDLRTYLGLRASDPDRTSYTPVLIVFATAFLLALALGWATRGDLFTTRTIDWFVGILMVLLAMLKLQDLDRFATMFLGYDLLAQRWVPYGYVYPFAEGLAGLLMVAGALDWLSVPLALFIGSIGAVSVIYAVYIQKRDLKCACVGGSSRVPLGFLSLTENLLMIGMAVRMAADHL